MHASSLRWMSAALALVAGCSVMENRMWTIEKARNVHDLQCRDWALGTALDGIVGALMLTAAIVAVSADEPHAGTIAATSAPAAGFLGSGTYGVTGLVRCRARERAIRARLP